MSMTGEATRHAVDHGEVGTIGEYRLLTMLLGTVTGVAIAASSSALVENAADQNRWLIFLLIAGLLGAAAGEAFGFGPTRPPSAS